MCQNSIKHPLKYLVRNFKYYQSYELLYNTNCNAQCSPDFINLHQCKHSLTFRCTVKTVQCARRNNRLSKPSRSSLTMALPLIKWPCKCRYARVFAIFSGFSVFSSVLHVLSDILNFHVCWVAISTSPAWFSRKFFPILVSMRCCPDIVIFFKLWRCCHTFSDVNFFDVLRTALIN